MHLPEFVCTTFAFQVLMKEGTRSQGPEFELGGCKLPDVGAGN